MRAEVQTAGRGRHGKVFESPRGNSYTSFILRPRVPLRDLPQLSLVAGLAVVDAISLLAPELPPARCKWPNDVLVNGRKVCGILVEKVGSNDTDPVVVGIGINLVSHPDIADMAIDDLRNLGARCPDRNLLLRYLGERLQVYVSTWECAGFGALKDAWLARAAGLGRNATIEGEYPVHGRVEGIDDGGALLIRQDGIVVRCHSGSLVFAEAI